MPRKRLPLILLAVGMLLLLSSILWFVFSRQFGSAALTIESVPEANVYINEEMVGRTPYSGEFKAGYISIKLLALAFDSPRVSYETNVKLTAGVNTVVNRTLGETELDSAGEIISFEKIGSSETAITVVTKPDSAQVSLDGKQQGKSPIRFANLDAGRHTLLITAEGYEQRNLEVEAKEGYTLTAIVQLAKTSQPEEAVKGLTVMEKPKEEPKKILILNTPYGSVPVRSEPNSTADQVSLVKPGDELMWVATDEKTGWHKIKVEDNLEGWITSNYAEIKEQVQE